MFPQRTKFLKRPIGWSDLSKVGIYYNEELKKDMYPICSLCHGRLRTGLENKRFFRYCPRCLAKITYNKE